MSGRYGEHDVEHYDRPRRRTRPRTKERPSYDDAVDGSVITVDRGRFTLLVEDRTVLAMKARPLGRKGVVVGDRVRVVGDVSGADGTTAGTAIFDDGNAGNAVGLHQREGIGEGGVGTDGDGIDHHAALETLDLPDLLGLFLRLEIAVDHAHSAGLRHGNRKARFFTAAGSANETLAALKVAAAWGYFPKKEA